jgi:hypothetical protein
MSFETIIDTIRTVNPFGGTAVNTTSSAAGAIVTTVSCTKCALKAVVTPSPVSKVLDTTSAGFHGTAAVLSALAALKGFTILTTPAGLVSGCVGYGLGIVGNAISVYADCMDGGIATAATEVGAEAITTVFKSKLAEECVNKAFNNMWMSFALP